MSEHKLRTESLFKLTWPVFLQHATNSVVMIVDFIFFSYLSDEIAATVGQALPVTWLGSFIIPVFASTGVAVASQYMGARKFDKVIPAYMMNLFFSLTMGLIITCSFALLRNDIGTWMGMSSAQNAIASQYLGMMSIYFIVMSVMVAYNAILTSRGLTQWVMVNSVVSGTLNVALNALFLFVFHWGLIGIVLSTIVATSISMFLGIYLVHAKLNIKFYLTGAWKDMCSVLRPMLKVGIPNAVEPFSYATQQIIISTYVISLGLQSMAANSYANRTLMFHIIFSFSLANGAQILMAHWMGAKKINRINQLYWKITLTGMFVSVIYMLIIWSQAYHIISIFTQDHGIRTLAKTLLFISLFMEPGRVVNIISGQTLRAVGDTRYPLIITVIFIWGILPIIYFYDKSWELSLLGIWIFFAIDEIIRAIINLRRWQSGKWKTMGLIESKSKDDVLT